MLARKIVVGLGIAAIFPALIYYGLSTFYPPPRQEDYFPSQPLPSATTEEERKAQAAEYFKKRADYDKAAKSFANVMFTISTVLGVIAMVLGAYLTSHTVGAGLLLGGICSLALSSWAFATHLDDWFRFLTLLVGFVALLFVGFRKIDRA
jgi:hypothetical protein